jgi:hypothetical protein
MNEQTRQLLEKLADKLGTTSEYLWSVLLKQAPIYATFTLIQTLFLLFAGWGLWKVQQKLLSKPEKSHYNSYYDKYEEGAVIPMIIISFVWIALMSIYFINFDSIINGYFNPEYWALTEILKSLK